MGLCLQLLRERGIPLERQENEVCRCLFLSLRTWAHQQWKQKYEGLIARTRDLKDREPFPLEYYQPLRDLWDDARVQECVTSASEASVPEK